MFYEDIITLDVSILKHLSTKSTISQHQFHTLSDIFVFLFFFSVLLVFNLHHLHDDDDELVYRQI